MLLLAQAVAVPVVYADDPPDGSTPAPQPTAEPAPRAQPGAAEKPSEDDDEPAFLFDPARWAGEVFNQVLTNLVRGISDGLRTAIDSASNSSLNFITRTPPEASYASPTVQDLWQVARAIANAALALIALGGGFNLIVKEHLGSPYHDAMELLPRLALGALLANTSLSWTQFAIDLNNALCGALGGASLPAFQQMDAASQLMVDLLVGLVYLVVGLLLLLQMLIRLALIDVLLVVSPLALICWVLPETHGWARLWSGTFLTAVFTQFVQVLALKLGGSLLTELAAAVGGSPLLSVFLGIAVLTLTLKIPGLLGNHAGDGLGFLRYYAYRRAAQALPGSRGGGGRPTPPAPTSAARVGGQ